ncbi:MAG: alkaline phosphatase family protein, partial [Bifidobacteriaceae bacterium]|nr:alkaline phosphatase family protein [Bifidobacteriaceae bacterium]
MPRYGPGGLSSVLPAAVARLGIALPGAPAPPELSDANRPRGIVLILADGLGLANLAARAGHAPFLWAGARRKLLAGFPSTTVTSLASLGTGLGPGRTAMAGYSLRDPASGRRANLIGWDAATGPETWQPHPTVFERLEAIGRPAAFVGEKRFAGSAMTRASLRGARFWPADAKPAAIVEATLAAAGAGDGLVYTYWGQLDKIGHSAGWESARWAQALEAFDYAAARLRRDLPRRWEVWLTADHGMVDVTGGPVWDVAEEPELADGVEVVAGEARAVHLYGADPAAVAARWRRRLGDGAWVLTKAEAV